MSLTQRRQDAKDLLRLINTTTAFRCDHDWEDLQKRYTWYSTSTDDYDTPVFKFEEVLQRCRRCWLERVVRPGSGEADEVVAR